MQEAEKVTWAVDKWVDDRDLEAKLNERAADDWTLVFAFRNGGNVETTTLVWNRELPDEISQTFSSGAVRFDTGV